MDIKDNQMADTLAKEATKMITTLKLPFTDYKTKIKHYIRRKWQTIWDMSPNNKLYEHQPTIKLEIAELLPNHRQGIILNRIRIGHTYLIHAQGRNCTLVYLLQSTTHSQSHIDWLQKMRTFARKATKQQPLLC